MLKFSCVENYYICTHSQIVINMENSDIRTFQDDDLQDIVLQALYRIPDYLSIENNILIPLHINSEQGRILIIRKRLVVEGLIEEKEPDSPSSLVKITPKGYQIIDDFGTYKNYKKEHRKISQSQRAIQQLEEKNLRLKNLNIIVGLISFLIGSLSGFLLSDPIKNILRRWLEAN